MTPARPKRAKTRSFPRKYVEDFSSRERRRCLQIVCRSRMDGFSLRRGPGVIYTPGRGALADIQHRISITKGIPAHENLCRRFFTRHQYRSVTNIVFHSWQRDFSASTDEQAYRPVQRVWFYRDGLNRGNAERYRGAQWSGPRGPYPPVLRRLT